MTKAKETPSLVAAAAALDEELRAFSDLASEAKRETLDTDRSMTRATRALSESAQRQSHIEEKLKSLVAEIEGARLRQQDSIDTLVQTARNVEQRAKSRDEFHRRFAELGSAAGEVNALALELASRRTEGAAEVEVLERLATIEQRMDEIVAGAQSIAEAASTERWPEIERQAAGVRQQMQAAKNKLALRKGRA
jgi:hypothetical protein